MTAVLEAPVLQTSSKAPSVHWCCIRQEDPPIVGLCGELPRGQRRTPLRVNCPGCLALISSHTAACAPCLPFAVGYR